MDNRDIDTFFRDSELTDAVERHADGPSVRWVFRAGRFPVLIQTQEEANRMRTVVFIADADQLNEDFLRIALEANYRSALDARYAISEGNLVAAFIQPFRELTLTQFILGLYQTINCAETCGSTFTGGTMIFGVTDRPPGTEPDEPPTEAEGAIYEIMNEVTTRIREGARG